MKALRRFTVRPQLPPPLLPLGGLIRNLRWSWHPASQDLFADIDRQLWAKFEGDPLKLLGAVSVSRLEELAADESFLARMHGLAADLDHYLQDPRWYQHQQTIGEPSREKFSLSLDGAANRQPAARARPARGAPGQPPQAEPI